MDLAQNVGGLPRGVRGASEVQEAENRVLLLLSQFEVLHVCFSWVQRFRS